MAFGERPSDGIPTTNRPKSMSGLDGLGWPTDDDKPEAGGDCSSAPCSPLAATPETDEAWNAYDRRAAGLHWVSEQMRQMERDRDEWKFHALMKLAVKQLACMWCGEIVHAPTGYEPGTPMSEEQRGQAYREHVGVCPKHPVAPLRKALQFIVTDKIANAADMRYRAARALESLPENDQGMARRLNDGRADQHPTNPNHE